MATTATTTPSSLEAALEANRKLQVEIISQAKRLAKEKAQNRRMASRVAAHLSATWDQLEDASAEPSRPGKTKRGGSGEEPKNGSSSTKASESNNRQNYLNRKWRYDPYRKWMRRFFVDPDGSIPRPNEDTRRRRTLEQGKPFFHASPPWSTNELETLKAVISELQNGAAPSELNSEMLETIDFDRVAQLLNEKMESDATRRTGPECRVNYLNSINASSFTKEESSRLLQLVRSEEDHPLSWSQIASALGNNRTPWQCFVAYQSKVCRSQPTLWTPAQDELLLKYAAAMGPQWNFHVGAAAQMSTRLLPDKTPKQILARAHSSLVNPSYVHDVWSDEEERKLVLCMKIYRDDPSPLLKAASHFPGRASKSVAEKWNRGLDPDLSSRPFTREEDQALLLAVKQSENLEWTQLARQFPGRHPRTLTSRWTELASHGDFMELCAQHGIVDRNIAGSALSGPNDFVVRVKPAAESSSIKES